MVFSLAFEKTCLGIVSICIIILLYSCNNKKNDIPFNYILRENNFFELNQMGNFLIKIGDDTSNVRKKCRELNYLILYDNDMDNFLIIDQEHHPIIRFMVDDNVVSYIEFNKIQNFKYQFKILEYSIGDTIIKDKYYFADSLWAYLGNFDKSENLYVFDTIQWKVGNCIEKELIFEGLFLFKTVRMINNKKSKICVFLIFSPEIESNSSSSSKHRVIDKICYYSF